MIFESAWKNSKYTVAIITPQLYCLPDYTRMHTHTHVHTHTCAMKKRDGREERKHCSLLPPEVSIPPWYQTSPYIHNPQAVRR